MVTLLLLNSMVLSMKMERMGMVNENAHFKNNWSRENSAMGLILASLENHPHRQDELEGRNLHRAYGKSGSGSKGKQVVYRVTDNYWLKVHYKINPAIARSSPILHT